MQVLICFLLQSFAQDLSGIPHVCHAERGCGGPEGVGTSQPCKYCVDLSDATAQMSISNLIA